MRHTDKPPILVTNDDGIESPGILAAVTALLPVAEVIVVAPRNQQSAMGRSHYGRAVERLLPMPYRVNGTEVEAYAVNTSPAMAVAHGIAVLFHNRPPALVVSGINYGENLGTNTSISGTVGAALEAASHGIPALAVSLETDPEYLQSYTTKEWEAASCFTRHFAKIVLQHKLPPDVDVLKIDVPADATPTTSWQITFQSRLSYFSRDIGEPHSEAPVGAGSVGCFFAREAIEPGSDIDILVNQRNVSVTPISLDMTARTNLAALHNAWHPL